MSEWYYAAGEGEKGPVSEADLCLLRAASVVTSATRVRREDSTDWALAETVPGLFARPAVQRNPVSHELAFPTGGLPDAVVTDAGPFQRVAKRFAVNDHTWAGPVVASPTAIYLLKAHRTYTSPGGTIGVLLKVLFSGQDFVRTCDVTELPPPVRAAIDPKGKRRRKDVIVLPRAAMQRVSASKLSGGISVQVGADRFTLTTGLFGLWKAAAVLERQGYVLETTLEHTMPPAHGIDYGLDPVEIGHRHSPLKKRLILGGVALGLVALLLYVHANG